MAWPSAGAESPTRRLLCRATNFCLGSIFPVQRPLSGVGLRNPRRQRADIGALSWLSVRLIGATQLTCYFRRDRTQ